MNISPYKKRLCLTTIIIFLLTFSGLSVSEENTHVLTAQQWNVPRHASSILSMPALQSTMQEYQMKKGNQLLIRYPGGDEGTLWAHELRGWLISLGVASKNIELLPGSVKSDELEITVIKPK